MLTVFNCWKRRWASCWVDKTSDSIALFWYCCCCINVLCSVLFFLSSTQKRSSFLVATSTKSGWASSMTTIMMNDLEVSDATKESWEVAQHKWNYSLCDYKIRSYVLLMSAKRFSQQCSFRISFTCAFGERAIRPTFGEPVNQPIWPPILR